MAIFPKTQELFTHDKIKPQQKKLRFFCKINLRIKFLFIIFVWGNYGHTFLIGNNLNLIKNENKYAILFGSN